MIDGKKNIEAWFEMTGMPYWIIYQKGKTESGNPSYRSDEREGVTVVDALQQLKKVLGIIGRGQYSIIASAKSNVTAKGTYREEFEISINESQAPSAASQVTGTAGPSLSPDDIRQQIASAIEEHDRKREHEEMKKKVAALEKEKRELEKRIEEPWNKVIGAIAPYTEHIVTGMFPAKAQVAGIPQADARVEENQVEETTELTADENERLANALSVFAQHDPDWLTTIERMAAKLSTNPNLLNMLKSFL